MKFAFDFHGVLQTYPEKFRPLMETLLGAGNKVIVLSGPPYKQIVDELNIMGYRKDAHYNKIISVVDWIKKSGVIMHQHDNGNWYCDDETWWGSKAKICVQEDIFYLFDDKLEYKKHIVNNNPMFFHVE